jgi:hypothetical protein
MTIFRESPKPGDLQFERRTPTIQERERLMGFSEGYFSVPCKYVLVLVSVLVSTFAKLPSLSYHPTVDILYDNLLTNGLEMNKKPTLDQTSNHWKDNLANEYHEFAGDYSNWKGEIHPFQFDSTSFPLKLKLTPPKATKTVCIMFHILTRCLPSSNSIVRRF